MLPGPTAPGARRISKLQRWKPGKCKHTTRFPSMKKSRRASEIPESARSNKNSIRRLPEIFILDNQQRGFKDSNLIGRLESGVKILIGD